MTGNGMAQCLPLFGQGFIVEGDQGGRLEELLIRELAVSPEFLQERVQTIFLNGKAIDRPADAQVDDGATIALSAAMPGLAGAVLRRGGVYADMRRQISHEIRGGIRTSARVSVTIKLFNLIAREIGPRLLQRGIRVRSVHLKDFFQRQGRIFWEACLNAEVDGRTCDGPSAVVRLSEEGLVRLSVRESGRQG
jgi:hypothetical protein